MAPGLPPPPQPQRFLAFDFGLKRLGVASGVTLLGQAQPLRTVAVQGDARWRAIQALLAEYQPDALVVGVPFHPDGAAHENTLRARRFARQLQGRFGLPVHQVDERYTTTEALENGSRDADAAAAALILEQHLRAVAASAASAATAATAASTVASIAVSTLAASSDAGARPVAPEPGTGPTMPP